MKQELEHRICEAALALFAQKPWADVTLDSIAQRAKTPLPTLSRRFASVTDLIPAIVRMIDTRLRESRPRFSKNESPNDRLFDVLMSRFEIMNNHRAGILALAEICRHEPVPAYAMYRAQIDSVNVMLDLAQLKAAAFGTTLTAHLLLGIYHLTFCRWAADETPDLAQTMAALNNTLLTCNVGRIIASD